MVYSPTARVLTVLELLQSHGRMTGQDLARRLEVNIRTVRDYIERLADLGIPVEAERGRYGGYRLRPGYKLPPLMFTEEEALALTLSVLMAREQGFTTLATSFEGVLAKIERVLPLATRERMQAVEQTVVFESHSEPIIPTMEVVLLLSATVRSCCTVRLRYCSARGEATERLYDPYGVVAYEGIWYTIGYCHLRQAQRLFRLDRVAALERTGNFFLRPEHFETLKEVQLALDSVPRTWQVKVWIQITLEEAVRTEAISRAQFEEMHDGVMMRCEVDALPWMAHLLAGLGKPFVIQRPSELRAEVRQYAGNLMRYAERSEYNE